MPLESWGRGKVGGNYESKTAHSKLLFLPGLQVKPSVDSSDCGTGTWDRDCRGSHNSHFAQVNGQSFTGGKILKRDVERNKNKTSYICMAVIFRTFFLCLLILQLSSSFHNIAWHFTFLTRKIERLMIMSVLFLIIISSFKLRRECSEVL